MTQRDYFLWLEACIADDRCYGSLLLKSRRSGFTTSAGSLLLYTQTRKYNSFAPVVAQTGKSSGSLFEDYVVAPLNKLPKFLQPLRIGEQTPKEKIEFRAPMQKITTKNSGMANYFSGLNSRIVMMNCTMNAFDGQAAYIALLDEMSKYLFDVNLFWGQGHKPK